MKVVHIKGQTLLNGGLWTPVPSSRGPKKQKGFALIVLFCDGIWSFAGVFWTLGLWMGEFGFRDRGFSFFDERENKKGLLGWRLRLKVRL